MCRAHRTADDRVVDRHGRPDNTCDNDTDNASGREQRSRAFAEAVRTGNLDSVMDSNVRALIEEVGLSYTMENEIGALRLLLVRAIAIDGLDGDIHDVTRTVSRLASEIGRAIRIQRDQQSADDDALLAALQEALRTDDDRSPAHTEAETGEERHDDEP